jgi:putative SOS response-associated peptidase YedK
VCGRYTLTVGGEELVEVFGVPAPSFEHLPRYNIAPTQLAPVIARDEQGTRLGRLRWGLVPSWAEDASVASKLINARGETVQTKPSFREAFRRRRCLVLADGFYEWVGEAGKKQPHWIHRPDREAMTFAGIWESWNGPQGSLHTYAIITVQASADLQRLHSRMPAIVHPQDREQWLESRHPADAAELLRTYSGALHHHAVSQLVNTPRNDAPELIEGLVA